MATTVTHTKLQLRTAYGPVFRDVLINPPRLATAEEIPVIDFADLYGDAEARLRFSQKIKHAATAYGFFYAKNHGIDETVIEKARKQALTFFKQPAEEKLKVSTAKSRFFNGYSAPKTTQVSEGESLDRKESFAWRYDAQYDPDPKDLSAIPAEVAAHLRGEEFVWEGTSNLPDFKTDILTYWQSGVKLARRLIQNFALALDLPENHFDKLTTYPGSDGVLNFYEANTPAEIAAMNSSSKSGDVGLGSHTDLQCFTLLWQDEVGGLQILTPEGQWIMAKPIPGTLVVNIGDYLMRLTNDKFKSTVHRVFNCSTFDRISMPFFFGFNFNEKCGVLPTCIDESNPPKYEPISCAEWTQLRFKQTQLTDTLAT
ncbi:Clavaminate synthase-like protein [Aureobasidium pullulans]|uniref:Clavaminate synthase-like protein n=1 Tax=Aureobasidium pullulans TaxID=5580 RepID=A0A4T0BL59_AURPU|nr:Clavaminate synthase-like protein [Aureobasidium pullulans]